MIQKIRVTRGSFLIRVPSGISVLSGAPDRGDGRSHGGRSSSPMRGLCWSMRIRMMISALVPLTCRGTVSPGHGELVDAVDQFVVLEGARPRSTAMRMVGMRRQRVA